MVSLDPDDFLADLADVPDHPSRPFPEKVTEEEELEWLSNKDSFPALETCMLPEEPPRQQKAIPNAEQGNGALLMPPMPSRKTKEDSCKAKSMKVCTFCGVSQTPKGPEDALGACNACGFSYKKSIKGEKVKNCESDKVKDIKKKCTHCEITKTPMWRAGPDGPKTLCNACGVRYRSGRLCPEYRPANSPTFLRELHSNLHRKVMKMRKQIHGIKGTVTKPVNKCTISAATTALKKMKNDMVPTVSTVNILEQPRRGVIADPQSPVSVQNNTKGSSILEPHQSPSKFLGQQQLFCGQLNNKLNPEDTAKVEVGRNTTILMSSCGTVKVSYKVPNKILEKQQLFSCQPTNKRRKKNTVKLKNEGNNATLMSSCGNLEPPHQLPIEFLEQHQLFDDQPNHNCNKKHTAKVEMTMKPVDVRDIDSSTTLMKSNKDSLPAVETLNILDHSRGHFITEQRSPVLVLQNSTNSSATLMSCYETYELPHQSPSKIFSQQPLVYNPDNSNPNKKDSAKVEIEGNSTSTMSSCGTATLPRQAANEIPGQQELFFDQHNNNCNKEDTAIVGTEVKCQNCGAKQSPQQWEDPLGPITLCLSCRLAKHTARRKRSTSLASNKRRKKEDTAKAEMVGKPGDKCTNSSAALKDSKKDPFVNTSNSSEQPNVVVISEQQTPAFVFGNSTMKKCTHCEITQTPQWREGPHGPGTLCNACGVRYKSGRLCPEYRPANSPTFSRELHSNCHKKIMEMRKQVYGIEGEVAKHVDKRTNSTATMALKNMKKDMFPTVTTVNILEQRKSVIAEQQNPVSVLENNIISSTTLEPQSPSKLLRQQQLVCNQFNNKNNQEDTAKVEVERNTSILMSSRGTIKLSDKVPTTVLEKQHLFNCQPTNKRRKKNTVKLKNDGNNATLMSFCGNIEPPHQVPTEFLEQHQLFYDQPNNNCNKKHTATVEMTMKPVDICGTLMKSKKDSFQAVEALNILDHSRGMFIAEQQSPILVLQNSTNSSATLMSSCETVELSHQSPSKIFRQQLLFPNPGNNLPNEKDTTQVEIEGNNTSTISSCGILTLPPHQVPNEFPGRQQLLFEQPNNNCNKKDTAIMGIEVKCQNCGAEKKPQQLEGPLGLKTSCLSCGRVKHTARRKRSVSLAFIKRRQKEDVAKVERAVKPSDIANAEHQKHFSVLENSTNNSMDLLSSCRITIPHRTRSKGLCRRSTIPGQQVGIGEKCVQCGKHTNRWRMGPLGPTTLCNTCGNKYPPLWGISEVTVDIAKCQHCGSEETTQWLMCPLGTKILCAVCYHWIMYGQQQFCNQTNNNPDRKASSEVVIGRKCYHCGIIAGPMGSETLCNVCRFRWYKFGDRW